MKGTRKPDLADADVSAARFQRGDYWKSTDDGTWHIVTPNGLYGWLRSHKVIEHDDGTITVPLTDDKGNDNAIMVGNGTKSWRGLCPKTLHFGVVLGQMP